MASRANRFYTEPRVIGSHPRAHPCRTVLSGKCRPATGRPNSRPCPLHWACSVRICACICRRTRARWSHLGLAKLDLGTGGIRRATCPSQGALRKALSTSYGGSPNIAPSILICRQFRLDPPGSAPEVVDEPGGGMFGVRLRIYIACPRRGTKV